MKKEFDVKNINGCKFIYIKNFEENNSSLKFTETLKFTDLQSLIKFWQLARKDFITYNETMFDKICYDVVIGPQRFKNVINVNYIYGLMITGVLFTFSRSSYARYDFPDFENCPVTLIIKSTSPKRGVK